MFQVSLPQAQPPFILSVDVGTSSVRAVLFDAQGSSILDSSFRSPVELILGTDGKAEIEARTLLESIWACINGILEHIGEGPSSCIAGVACSTLASRLLGINRVGEPVTPVYIYADTRPEEDAQQLRQQLDLDAVLQCTGCTIHSSYLPARLLWLKRMRPSLFAGEVRWMSIGEYILLKLFGSTDVSYSVASWTGLLDRRRLDWDDELLSLLPIERKHLSKLVDLDQSWSGLQEPFASRWPALRNRP